MNVNAASGSGPVGLRRRQLEIARELGVQASIDPAAAIERRIHFLVRFLLKSGSTGFVLGVSGGQDSFNAAAIAQRTVARLREGTGDSRYRFVALRLPYGIQRDEDDAQRALAAIGPDEVLTVNIQPAVDASAAEYERAVGRPLSDFAKGNVKARERMVAQYQVANERGYLVIGTDHAAEALMGFFTKWGDGGADVCPLQTLDKRQGRQVARLLGCPEAILRKRPTADLEDMRPQLPDEEVYGVAYDVLDDFLEGREVPPETARRIIATYEATRHKREPIPGI